MPNEPKNNKWPDDSGFHFDTPPENLMRAYAGHGEQEREPHYGAKYVDVPSGAGYKPWSNWFDKFEPDVRFAAISDSNAHLQHFPEVDTPWKFTEYTFQGIRDGQTVTAQPPLFEPKSLSQINEGLGYGQLDGTHFSYYINLYEYMGASGTIYKQEDLDKGIAYTGPEGTEMRASPWVDPAATGEMAKDSRTFTKQNPYMQKLQFLYPSENKGVRICRSYVAVKSRKMGAHGNIPPHTLNMAAPKSYFEPDNMYMNMVVPKITATFGSPVMAVTDGIVRYGTTYYGPASIYVTEIDETELEFEDVPLPPGPVSPDSGELKGAMTVTRATPRWKITKLKEVEVLQPKPNEVISRDAEFLLNLKIAATNYSSGEYVHKGCAFWKGTGTWTESNGVFTFSDGIVRCTAQDTMANPSLAVPLPATCKLYPPEGSELEPKAYYQANGGTCPFYQHNGPREIALFEAKASTIADTMKTFAGIDDYNVTGGASNLIDGKAMYAMSGIPLIGLGLFTAGALMLKYGNMTSLPRQMGDTDTRWNIEYEFKKMPLYRRETYATKFKNKSDFLTYRRGTGRYAFDSYDTTYGGVDTNFFGDRNLLSIARFNRSVMPCYDPEKCNSAYGMTKMYKGFVDGRPAGVGGEEYCRYYDNECPHSNVPRRAFEYDRNYVALLGTVRDRFRNQGGLYGFENKLLEHKIADGVYCAIGPKGLYSITTIDNFPVQDQCIYFYYTKSVLADDHLLSRLFAHITHYSHEGTVLKSALAEEQRPDGYPDEIPWLVELLDDYVSPVSFVQYIDNESGFFGGRSPEYKDMTKIGKEVLCSFGAGGSIYGASGGNSQDMGGDPEHAATQDKGYYMGYRTDVTGEYITDGRRIGDFSQGSQSYPNPSDGMRTGTSPEMFGSATPIDGALGRTIITPDIMQSPRVVKAWVYSSDSREELQRLINASEPINEEGKPCPPNMPPPGNLPSERVYDICPHCTFPEKTDILHLMTEEEIQQIKDTEGLTDDDICSYDCRHVSPKLVEHGFTFFTESVRNQLQLPDPIRFITKPSIDATIDTGMLVNISSDEAVPILVCPACFRDISHIGTWINFAGVYAMGNVSVWSLPGDTVRLDGVYWKNPTMVNRSIIGKALMKLGDKNANGGGFKFNKDSSANEVNEGMPPYYPLKTYAGYIEEKDKAEEEERQEEFPRLANYIHPSGQDISRIEGNPELAIPASVVSDTRIDGGEYVDDMIGSSPGLDMITVNHLKWLRNMIEPMYGYEIGSETYMDFYGEKQNSHTNRYTGYVPRTIYFKQGRLQPQILASSESGRDQWTQFWDGTLIPATIIYNYWPTGPTWWRLHNCIGGISRKGGTSAIHLDDSVSGGGGPSSWYTGDRVQAGAYYFMHGWIPLDKEIVKAYAIITPTGEPDAPPVGRTWVGVTRNEHYHAWMTEHEGVQGGEVEDHYQLSSDSKHGIRLCGGSVGMGFSGEEYRSYMHDFQTAFNGRDQAISHFSDLSYGYSLPGSNLTWAGYGQDMVQTKTDEQIWKKYTFDEFKDIIRKDSMTCRFSAGKEGVDETAYTYTMFSKRLLGITLNNEVQPIPGYFDYSGMNKKLMYPKDGPMFAKQNINTAWANSGQVVLQSDSSSGIGRTEGEWTDGGLGMGGAGWNDRVLDITNLVKGRYDARLNRVYVIQCGVDFAYISNVDPYIEAISYDTTEQYAPDPTVNYRYLEDNDVWLNDCWHFPELEDGEFPIIESGDMHGFNPNGRIESFSGHYVQDGKDSGQADYYNYHPLVLIQTDRTLCIDSGGEMSEPEPSTTGGWSMSGNSPVWVPGGAESRYWYNMSNSPDEQTIVFNLASFPVEESRRPYRHKKGAWDVSNAKCPSADCPAHPYTVSQLIQRQEDMSRTRAAIMPSLYAVNCCYCGSRLDSVETGAIYADGDGITTVSYSELMEKDVFISKVRVRPKLGSTIETDFAVDVLHGGRDKWTNLFSVRWNSASSKWMYLQYLSDKTMEMKEEASLPDAFLGAFANEENAANASADDIAGKHFIIPRACKIRFRTTPRKITAYSPSTSGGEYLESYSSNNRITPSGVKFVNDLWQGARLQLADDFDDVLYEYGVISNSDAAVYCSSDIAKTGQESPSKWRLVSDDIYVASCEVFEVYGHAVKPGTVTMTPDCDCITHPLSIGNNTVRLPDFPTKIISVKVGSGDSVSLSLTEMETMDSDSFFFTSVKREFGTVGYQEIVSGIYYFNPSSKSISIPGRWKNPDTDESGDIWSLNMDKDQTVFRFPLVFDFIEVRYMTGLGVPMDMTATALGTGPSYQVEKDAICNIYDQEDPEEAPRPDKIDEYLSGSPSFALPDMGFSAKMGTNLNYAKSKLYWKVYNHEPMRGEFSVSRLSGNEVQGFGSGAFSESSVEILFGGSDQEYAGLPQGSPPAIPATRITGRASGTVTVYGCPNTILSGSIYAYARDITTRTCGDVVTYERTGGLKYTGFYVKNVPEPIEGGSGRCGVCFSRPRIIIYAKERELTEQLE